MEHLPLGPRVLTAAPSLPGQDRHDGRAVRLEPLCDRHVDDLWLAAAAAEASWTYLKYGPFATRNALADHIAAVASNAGQPFFAVVPASSGRAEGWASFCDIAPADAPSKLAAFGFRHACNGRARPAKPSS